MGYHTQSLILTADYNNHCIHILDQNGQFLRYIDNCDLKFPCGVCVNNKDSLILCEYEKGTVKEIKYRTLVCDNQEWQFSQYKGCSEITKTTHLFSFLRDDFLEETGIKI